MHEVHSIRDRMEPGPEITPTQSTVISRKLAVRTAALERQPTNPTLSLVIWSDPLPHSHCHPFLERHLQLGRGRRVSATRRRGHLWCTFPVYSPYSLLASIHPTSRVYTCIYYTFHVYMYGRGSARAYACNTAKPKVLEFHSDTLSCCSEAV